jgi:hypothetical protein
MKPTSTSSPAASEQALPKSTVTAAAPTAPAPAPAPAPACEQVGAASSTSLTLTGDEPKGLEGVTLTQVPELDPDRATVTLNLTLKLVTAPATTTPGEATTSLTPLAGASIAYVDVATSP